MQQQYMKKKKKKKKRRGKHSIFLKSFCLLVLNHADDFNKNYSAAEW